MSQKAGRYHLGSSGAIRRRSLGRSPRILERTGGLKNRRRSTSSSRSFVTQFLLRSTSASHSTKLTAFSVRSLIDSNEDTTPPRTRYRLDRPIYATPCRLSTWPCADRSQSTLPFQLPVICAVQTPPRRPRPAPRRLLRPGAGGCRRPADRWRRAAPDRSWRLTADPSGWSPTYRSDRPMLCHSGAVIEAEARPPTCAPGVPGRESAGTVARNHAH
jgi:hypothetical protein